MKATNFQVEVKPFGFVVQVVVANTIKSCIDFCNRNLPLKEKMVNEDRFGTYGGVFFPYERQSFIFLTKDSTVHDLVHDSFHALMHTAYSRGAKFSRKAEEFFAYSLGEFTETLSKKFTEAINK